MKQKKLVYIFLILSTSLTLSLPILNLYFTSTDAKTNLQSFSKQKLFSTNNLESIQNYIAYKIFHISLNESQVIVGKDGFFFLGDMFRSVVSKSKGTFYYDNKQIEAWTSKLKKLQAWYENQGVEFIVVVASNKHTVYSNKLPDNIPYKEGQTITDDIIQSSLSRDIHILNLKQALKAEKKVKQLYFKRDTHWNNYAAFIAYLNTIKYLNATNKKNYIIPEYTMKKTTSKGGGDLTNFLRINHFLSNKDIKNYSFQFEKNNNICYGEITKTNKLKTCTPGDKNTFNQYSINKSAPNKAKLLYLCDSFGPANTSFYLHTFDTVWRFHLTYINGDILTEFIQKQKPDIVIYQIVERDLGNNSIIDDIPNTPPKI